MEHDPGYTYLVIAYSGFFLLLAGFVFRMQRRQGELEDELSSLEQQLGATGSKS